MGKPSSSVRQPPWLAIGTCAVVGIVLIVVGAFFAVELMGIGVGLLLGGPILLLLLSGSLWNPKPPLDFYRWFYDSEHRPGEKSRDG
jgi:hypothetical protein